MPEIEVTRRLARYVHAATLDEMPMPVRDQGVRAFVNWMGCVLGGCRHEHVDIALATVAEFAGRPSTTVIGRALRLDIVSAAFINSLSSSVNAFNDMHPATAIHPTGPVAAALLGIAERQKCSGGQWLASLILGIELQCRLGTMLIVPPARCRLGLSPTGLVGAVGAAAAAGKLLGLDVEHLIWAIGLAAAQAAGFRETIGSMAGNFVPARTAATGLTAALMAAQGFTCAEHSIEGEKGFATTYGDPPNLDAAVAALGQHYVTMELACKPYPCGVWVNPTVDLCLRLKRACGISGSEVSSVELRVHPRALEIAGRRDPATAIEAQASLYHWAAATLLRGEAGLPEASGRCVQDADVVALRQRIAIRSDPSFGPDAAHGVIRMRDGRVLHSDGTATPMRDDGIAAKFLVQAAGVLPADRARELLEQSWRIGEIADVGAFVRGFFEAG